MLITDSLGEITYIIMVGHISALISSCNKTFPGIYSYHHCMLEAVCASSWYDYIPLPIIDSIYL